jgi:hypothetical protein
MADSNQLTAFALQKIPVKNERNKYSRLILQAKAKSQKLRAKGQLPAANR